MKNIYRTALAVCFLLAPNLAASSKNKPGRRTSNTVQKLENGQTPASSIKQKVENETNKKSFALDTTITQQPKPINTPAQLNAQNNNNNDCDYDCVADREVISESSSSSSSRPQTPNNSLAGDLMEELIAVPNTQEELPAESKSISTMLVLTKPDTTTDKVDRGGWKKPNNFTQFIYHNTEQDPTTKKLKDSIIISSPHTDSEQTEINCKDSAEKLIRTKYITQKWFYEKAGKPTQDARGPVEKELLKYADISVQQAAQENPTIEQLKEKTKHLSAILQDIKTTFFNKTVNNLVRKHLNTLPENYIATEEEMDLLRKKTCEELQKNMLPNEWIFESPNPTEYPGIKFTSEQITTLAVQASKSAQNINEDTTRVYGTKANSIVINATGNNTLDADQKEFIEKTVELLNNPNIIRVGDNLVDISTTGQKANFTSLPSLTLPNLSPSKITIGIYTALETLRRETKIFKDAFLAQANQEPQFIEDAFRKYATGTPEKSSVKEIERLNAARRAYVLGASAQIEKHAKNYAAKRDLLVVNKDVAIAHTLQLPPHETAAKSVLSWFGIRSATTTALNQ